MHPVADGQSPAAPATSPYCESSRPTRASTDTRELPRGLPWRVHGQHLLLALCWCSPHGRGRTLDPWQGTTGRQTSCCPFSGSAHGNTRHGTSECTTYATETHTHTLGHGHTANDTRTTRLAHHASLRRADGDANICPIATFAGQRCIDRLAEGLWQSQRGRDGLCGRGGRQ